MVQINNNSFGGSQENILIVIFSICITISMIIGILGIKLKKFRFRQSLNFDLIQNESENGNNNYQQLNRSHSILSSQNDELMRGVFRIRNDDEDSNFIDRSKSLPNVRKPNQIIHQSQTFLIEKNSKITEASSSQYFHNTKISKILTEQQTDKNIENNNTDIAVDHINHQSNTKKEINFHKNLETTPKSILVKHHQRTQDNFSKINAKRYQKVRIRSPPVTPTKYITEIFPSVQNENNISNQFHTKTEQNIEIDLIKKNTINSNLKDDKNNFFNNKTTETVELKTQFNEQNEQSLNQISNDNKNDIKTFKSSKIRPPVPKPRKNYLLNEKISSETNEAVINVIKAPKPKPRNIKNYEDIEKDKSIYFKNEKNIEKNDTCDDSWSDIRKHRYLTKEAKINKIKKDEQRNIHKGKEIINNENHKLKNYHAHEMIIEKPRTLRDMKNNQKNSEIRELGITINLNYDSSKA